ncbi:hypothetical protein MAMC_00623 [Methylacidimicrobium cyclopophantes]|uniref:Glycosyltransferase GT-D fold domain-containing protein n=1 Tax=Methylacidimicrobium cyclopophantes TaxID=1041766 RepID=A0A5E6MCJ2_9BACT|nr:hypothetical protein [Methylacidimicrobium cyclopophantes]VVM05491.1 hypothetical protein MAMC_00623 [Methylacidimicrobium cyclopophantes]
MTQDFQKDFDEFLTLLDNEKPFAFARFNDGEARILANQPVGCRHEWQYRPERDLHFRSSLRESLRVRDEAYFYGLPSWDMSPWMHDLVRSLTTADPSRLTFAALFANGNHDRFLEEFVPRFRRTSRPIVFVGNARLSRSRLQEALGVSDFLPLPGDCVKLWKSKERELLDILDLKASLFRGALFLIAGGPLGKILIHALWRVSRENVYLDVGSALDPLLFGRPTRAYHRDPANRALIPCWKPLEEGAALSMTVQPPREKQPSS